jgi:peptidoglycan/LPS O-acetylase OafA/YrhL
MDVPASAPFDSFRRSRYWPSLDGLRALAIVPVVWHHVGGHRGGIYGRGPLGVELFFAISGFLITSLLLRERDATGAISLRGFYLRRSLRIFPLYYAVLFAYVILVPLVERDPSAAAGFWRNLPAYLTYTSNWFVELGPRVIFYFAWSLACEEQFYCLWPSVVAHTNRAGAAVAMAAILAAIQFAPGSVRLAGPICLGCVAALAVHGRTGFGVAWAALGRRWSAPAAAAAVAACVILNPPLLVTGLAMTALVVACTLRRDHGLAAPLDWRPIRYVGEISYGIYLLHMLALNVVRLTPIRNEGLMFLAALAGAIGAASVSHRWFERPILRLKDRIPAAVLAPRRPAPGAATPRA